MRALPYASTKVTSHDGVADLAEEIPKVKASTAVAPAT